MKYVFIMILLLGCSSTKLDIKSDPPEAKVFILENQIPKELGATPLTLDTNDLNLKDSGVNLLIVKDGFQKQSFFIEERLLPSTGTIQTKLDPIQKVDTSNEQFQADWKNLVSKVASQVSQIQSWLLKKDYPQAEVLTRTLLNENPTLAVGWNLLGNTYYLQGRYAEAEEAYSKALTIEPENIDTQSVLQKIRLPASKRGN